MDTLSNTREIVLQDGIQVEADAFEPSRRPECGPYYSFETLLDTLDVVGAVFEPVSRRH